MKNYQKDLKLEVFGFRPDFIVLFILLVSLLCIESIAQEVKVDDKRMADYHCSVVTTGTEMPSSAFPTYLVNSKGTEFKLSTGIDHIILPLDISPVKKIFINFEYNPVDYKVSAPSSYAEVEPFRSTLLVLPSQK